MTANPAKHEKPSTTVDDAAVIDRVIAGDTNAFELLMIKYEAAVLNRVRRHIPDEARQDVLQDVFIRAYRSLDTCRNKDGFGAWLASIAVRTCYDFWRKRYRCKETAVSTLSMAQQDWIDKMSARQGSDDYQRRLARKEAREVLDWALSRLSPEDRMVLELVHLQEMTTKEAAQLLDWSVVNVKVRAHRSRKKLKELIEGLMDEHRRDR
ncbi:RNA polymerase sigma factor [uncultured Desulfosarcina sp.]|uniref:RNA polymerase sigma factor n=1 Tax=uncultured Desulfosarcina sp. TaxID=218289 RepID=UPI0029C95A5E|nr:RNA polymerase sigma factor [uncultured Desulfosarcina sp.]